MDDVDRRILAFIGAHRFVLPGHVEPFVELESDVAAERLQGLEDEGLVRSERVLVWRASSFRITSAGLEAIGSRLPVPGFELAGYRHEVGVVWLWIAAWRGTFGEPERVLSRREMEGLDRAAREAGEGGGAGGFAVRVGVDAGPGSGGHWYPDVAVELARGRLAVHLQLRVPSSVMLEALVAGYRSDHERVRWVVFATDERPVAAAVEAVTTRLGVADWVRVQRVGIHPTDRLVPG